MDEQYINPFSEESETYAQKLDIASITGLLSEIEKTLPDADAAPQFRLYYSIGTVYSDSAKAKGLSHQESLKKQLYCFRKSVDVMVMQMPLITFFPDTTKLPSSWIRRRQFCYCDLSKIPSNEPKAQMCPRGSRG